MSAWDLDSGNESVGEIILQLENNDNYGGNDDNNALDDVMDDLNLGGINDVIDNMICRRRHAVALPPPPPSCHQRCAFTLLQPPLCCHRAAAVALCTDTALPSPPRHRQAAADVALSR